jgi:hypothetical protein
LNALGDKKDRQTSGVWGIQCSGEGSDVGIGVIGVNNGVCDGPLVTEFDGKTLEVALPVFAGWIAGDIVKVSIVLPVDPDPRSCVMLREVRPVRRDTLYSQGSRRRTQRPQIGFSLLHLTFEFAQWMQLSRSFRGCCPLGRRRELDSEQTELDGKGSVIMNHDVCGCWG